LNAELVALAHTKTKKNLVQLIEMNGAPERQSVLQATQILQNIKFPFYYVLLHLSNDQIYPPPQYFPNFWASFSKKTL
jgi:hypothetical protein